MFSLGPDFFFWLSEKKLLENAESNQLNGELLVWGLGGLGLLLKSTPKQSQTTQVPNQQFTISWSQVDQNPSFQLDSPLEALKFW